MLVREIQISCLLASAFTLSILNYADDTALARPVHQGTEKNQSTGKPASIGEARPKATGRQQTIRRAPKRSAPTKR
jgi:hypothetical protein